MVNVLCALVHFILVSLSSFLLNASTELEFRDILGGDEFDFRYDCGISKPVSRISFFDREKIVNAFSLHY